MMPSSDLRVLFRVAAGPRRGFGHLVRSLSIARAHGGRPLLSVRGPTTVIDTALSLGADVLSDRGLRPIRALSPDIVIVDDPIARDARRWVTAARRAGSVVVTVHDLGIGWVDGDIVVDGSVTRQAHADGRVVLAGTRYAIIDPDLAAHARARVAPGSRRVLVALGGGPRRTSARAIARAILAADPRAEVRIAGGFNGSGPVGEGPMTWLPPTRGLARELFRATVAVVAGGVSLYEACAAGVPAIGIPVVPGQSPTVRGFGRRGAVIALPFKSPERRTAAAVVALLDDPHRREVLRRRAMRMVDGKGAGRVAAAVLAFVRRAHP
jgi:spore coat polysaccharide biosynthesis predicted glycosyltransferase SpsG